MVAIGIKFLWVGWSRWWEIGAFFICALGPSFLVSHPGGLEHVTAAVAFAGYLAIAMGAALWRTTPPQSRRFDVGAAASPDGLRLWKVLRSALVAEGFVAILLAVTGLGPAGTHLVSLGVMLATLGAFVITTRRLLTSRAEP
jgi:hypothetical protein